MLLLHLIEIVHLKSMNILQFGIKLYKEHLCYWHSTLLKLFHIKPNQFFSSFSVAPPRTNFSRHFPLLQHENDEREREREREKEREKTGSMLTILVNIEPVMYSRSFASWRIWIHMIWSIWTVRCRSSIVIWMSPISIRCCSHTQVSNIKHYQIKKPPSRCQYNAQSMQFPMQI